MDTRRETSPLTGTTPGRPPGVRPSPSSAAPASIGPYAIEGELGRGGMGVVFRARDPRLGRPVAIKMLLGTSLADERSRRRFAQEARSAAALRHPGVVGVLEVGEQAGSPYIVMDLVEGSSLDVVVRTGPLPPRHAARLAHGVAEALAHAHEHGIVHRDVKPQNVIVDGDGAPHLTDFGIARDTQATGITRSGHMLGTPGFAPPEQVVGDLGRIGPRSDIYGAGSVLYFALTGAPPIEGASTIELVAATVSRTPDRPSRRFPSVHADLETICLRCLEKDPADRYASAAALAADLRLFLDGQPITTRPVGRLERVRRSVVRHPIRTTGLVLLLAAAIGLAGAGLWVLGQERLRAEAATRAAIVGEARVESERRWRAFVAAREAADRSESAGGDDALLGLGLDALHAATRLADLDPADADAARGAFRAAIALGEVAEEAEQWSVAASVYERARRLGIDEPAAAAALAELQVARGRLAERRRDAVGAVLDEARANALSVRPEDYQRALLAIVRLAEPGTVELVVEALEEITETLRTEVVAQLTAVAEPDAVERADGAIRIVGLAEAVERGLAGPLERDDLAKVNAASSRLARRTRRAFENTSTFERRSGRAVDIVAAAQRRRLGPAAVDLARLCCDALRGLGIRERAFAAVQRYIFAEFDEDRAAVAAITLLELGGEEAHDLVRAAGDRFPRQGIFWTRLEPRVGDSLPGGHVPTAGSGAGGRSLAQARAEIERQISADPESSRLRNNLGVCLLRMGDLEGAVAAFHAAAELAPNDPVPRANKAAVLVDLGRPDEAVEECIRAIEARGGHAEGWIQRARAYQALGRLDAARADIDRALALAPGQSRAWLQSARLRIASGDQAGAATDANRAVELAPASTDALRVRARTRAEARDLGGALEDLDRLVGLASRDAGLRQWRGTIRRRNGDLAGAIDDYDVAIELDPSAPQSWTGRSQLRRMRGDLEGAVADQEQAIALAPGDAALWNDLGLCWAGADDDRAVEAYRKALELSPRLAVAWNNLGMIHARRAELDEAGEAFEKAIGLAPRMWQGWKNRADLRERTGDRAGAVGDLERVLEVAPRHASAPELRARIERLRSGD